MRLINSKQLLNITFGLRDILIASPAICNICLGEERPSHIGISFGGPVDYKSGVVRLRHHVPGWENVPIQQLFAEAFGAPVGVDNDANVAALGEWRFGAGRGVADLLYVTVSTGVGGGWILDGRPYRGASGMVMPIMIVIVAVFLLWLAIHAGRRGWLR